MHRGDLASCGSFVNFTVNPLRPQYGSARDTIPNSMVVKRVVWTAAVVSVDREVPVLYPV